MRIRYLLIVLVVLGTFTAAATAAARPATPPPLESVHAARDATWHWQRLAGHCCRPYGWVADRHTTTTRERWAIAARWWKLADQAHTRLVRERSSIDSIRHGTPAQCYAYVRQRFAPLGASAVALAVAIVTRESGCTWYAQNPTSTAAGPWQFLDFWGTLAERTDVVWSTDRAYRAVVDGGWSPWYPLP